MLDKIFDRDAALQPLSRDHGVLLVLAQRLRKAAAGTTQDRICLAGELREKFAGLVEEYLADETDALSSVKFSQYVRDEVVSDHAKIAMAIKVLARAGNSTLTAECFTALADLIEQHVRWDERMMVPYLQRELTDSDRAKLSMKTSALESRHARPIGKLHHSITLDKKAGQAQTCTCADSVTHGD